MASPIPVKNLCLLLFVNKFVKVTTIKVTSVKVTSVKFTSVKVTAVDTVQL
jgi:hypothetical protein